MSNPTVLSAAAKFRHLASGKKSEDSVPTRYPLDIDQAPVVQTLDRAIHWINHSPLDNSIGFASVYPLDSDLSGGQRYPSFEQLGPGCGTRSQQQKAV